jgi:L-alanine-DL-glutamate epimerase-like enolase superfamily enzyme
MLAAVKITRLSTAVIEANFDWTLIRVDTDEGISGLGEAFFNPGLSATVAEFGSLLAGEDPLDVDRLAAKMTWAASAGQAMHAISGIEAALLDLKGKALGVPIWQLLGGAFRRRVRIYADCHAGETLESLGPLLVRRHPRWLEGDETTAATGYYEAYGDRADAYTPDAYASKAKRVVDAGFTFLKFDLDVPTPGVEPDHHARWLAPAQLDHLSELVHAAVDAVPRHVEVAFDCHWRLTRRDATRLAKAIEDVPVAWLEDPLPPGDIDSLTYLTQSTSTPIGTGENWYRREGFREAIERGAIDIALPDLQKCGGLREGQRIAELADLHGMLVSPHNISGPIGTLAAAHVGAAIPNLLAVEFHAQDVPFFDDLLAEGFRPLLHDGYIEMTDAPGLGVELDLDVARRYAKAGEPFFDEA